MKPKLSTIICHLALTGLTALLMACGGPGPKPDGPSDPSKINLELIPLGYQDLTDTTGLIEFQYTVKNDNKGSIYVVSGSNMPYVTVIDPTHVHFEFRITDPGRDYAAFDPPNLIEVAGNDAYAFNFKVNYPLQPGSHYSRPLPAVPTASDIHVKITQGYGDNPFVFNPISYSILEDFLTYQKIKESGRVSLTGL